MSEHRGHNPYDLPAERLATTDEDGHRVYLYPEDVRGKWKDRRLLMYAFLIFIFMVLPWIHFKGKQIILLNIPKREFIFFGHTFFGHDAPFLIFFLLFFGLGIGLVTALYGRVWCGWACPQTVFIQSVYTKIEQWVEGGARRRQKRDAAPWTFEKAGLKGLKWLLFLIVSLHLSHSVLGYFVGTRELFMISMGPPSEHMTLFVIMLFLTGIFLFDFGWFREQFCIIACPYGRFQSVIMDEHSTVVAYDATRGEPRRSADIPKDQQGDCVNCFHCVKVCPTGIDIRRGASQLECIACTQCIDACDEIMERVGKPTGLIRYTTERELKGEKTQRIRPRTMIYGTILVGVLVAFTLTLQKRFDVDVTFIRATGAPYQVVDGGREIINRYTANIQNNSSEELGIVFMPPEELAESLRIVIQRSPYPAGVGRTSVGVFFRFDPAILQTGNLRVPIKMFSKNSGEEPVLLKEVEVNLVGPF
jgi:cytochrome c oxidase accessory protein FixG